MIRILFGVLFFFAGLVAYSKTVTVEEAGQLAIRFLNDRLRPEMMSEPVHPTITTTTQCEKEGLVVYYIFNFNPTGYVIVSADDAVIPVLAYSLSGNYTATEAPPQFTAWMQQYTDQIAYAISNKIAATPDVKIVWNELRSDLGSLIPPPGSGIIRHPSGFTSGSQPEVSPLITSNWNQNAPYNSACPPDPAGPGGHTYAGCVPVCMGQLMYYYRWPETGTGTYSYSNPPYGTLTADFGSTTYKWEEMTNTLSANSPEIAKLLFHLGISCDLQYGPDGSGMYNHKAAYSLRTFFKYSHQTQYVYRDSTTLSWDSILVAHLNRKMPLYYAGWSVPNIMGHAFVCDGYQYDSLVQKYYFHFNFGWSGSNNGYFYTDDLFVGGNNFNLAQEVIINAYPDTINYTYPKFCQGARKLTFGFGSFGDGGSPMENYSPDADCSWLIDPQTVEDSVTNITLKVGTFSTSPGDYMTVYDGETTEAPVLWHYAGNDSAPVVTSSGNKMLITFKANGGPTSTGWFCTYASTVPVYCSGITTITADTAVVSDGCAPFNYHNNSNCRWKLFSTGNQPLTIHFRRFDTEPDKDVLRIFDLTTGDTLASLSGQYEGSLPDSVTAPNGKMFLNFTTNGSVTGKGWEIYYPHSHVGMDEDDLLLNLNIYPNPATDRFTIRADKSKVTGFKFELRSLDGKLIKHGVNLTGEQEVKVSVASLSRGLYFLRIITGSATVARKIVIQ